MNGENQNLRPHSPCNEYAELISSFLDDELTPQEREKVQLHLNDCDQCREYASVLQQDQVLFETRFSTITARSDFTERVLSKLRSERKIPVMEKNQEEVVDEKTRDSAQPQLQPQMISGREVFRRKRFSLRWWQVAPAFGLFAACLVVVLFPVFARAREKARNANCQSNLKQIGIVFHMYVEDNGRLPNITNWVDALMPYAKNQQLFVCPFEQGTKHLYAMNPSLSERSYDAIPEPMNVVLAYDSVNGEVSYRHNGGANVLFADGHVKWISEAKVPGLGLKTSGMGRPFGSDSSKIIDNADQWGRRISYQASLVVEAKKPSLAVSTAESIIAKYGGFILASNVSELEKGLIQANLTARVPKTRLVETVNELAGLGDLKKREIVGEDVTEQYVNAQQNLGESYERADRLAGVKTKRVPQKLNLEQNLQEVAKRRTESRRELSRLSGITELVTINVCITSPAVISSYPPAFETAANLVKQIAYFVYTVGGFIVICSPIWLPLLAGWLLWQRRKQHVVIATTQ